MERKTPGRDKKKESSSDRQRDEQESDPSASEVEPVGSLHRTVGNQAVQCLYRKGEIQAALSVSHPSDPAEREAERVAEQVMRVSDLDPASNPRGGVEINRKETSDEPTVNAETKVEIDSATSDGKPLSPSTRSYFEPRFGHDFSDVRVHTDQQADQAARSINAEAFTHSNDIFFRSGNYKPGSEQGKKLLAHELTHVVQQERFTENRSLQAHPSARTKKVIQRQKEKNTSKKSKQQYNTIEKQKFDEKKVGTKWGGGIGIGVEDDSYVRYSYVSNPKDDKSRKQWEWNLSLIIEDFRDDSFGNNTGESTVNGTIRVKEEDGKPKLIGDGGFVKINRNVHIFGNVKMNADLVPDGKNYRLTFGFAYSNARSDAMGGGGLDVGPWSIGISSQGPVASGGAVGKEGIVLSTFYPIGH